METVAELWIETTDYQHKLVGRTSSGAEVVYDAWYPDERDCHIRNPDAWIGKPEFRLSETVHQREVDMIRSWV